jgi:dTDP-4-amino-4,6-dideoxygalactose transaminase
MTFVATFEAVSQVGATPVPVDVSEQTACIDPAAAAAAIGPRTRAILPVHLYGRLADLAALGELADSHNLVVLEDACQAHGAGLDGRRAGRGTAAAAFSFYPGKNLGAYGDAGAVTTNDSELADEVRLRRDLGQRAKYEHVALAGNERLDTLQAAVLRVKLRHLARWNELRREHAATYSQLLRELVETPPVAPWALPVWHLYVIRVANRDGVRDALAKNGIATGMHYPLPLHLQPALSSLGYREGDFPAAETWSRTLLSLPLFPELERSEIERVVEVVSRVAVPATA